MVQNLNVPKIFHGEYRSVKKKVSSCVREAKTPQNLILQLQEIVVPGDQIEKMFLIESLGAGEEKQQVNYWCDALMIELDRKFENVEEIRSWSFELLNVPWGGLTFLSQEANGVLQSQEFCIKYVKWMIDNADRLDRLGKRFSLTGRGAATKIWEAPTNLGGALGALGARMEDFPDRSMTTFCELAKRLLRAADYGS